MKLIGLMTVRNEDWVIGLSARVALQWCDSILVLDHASTDRTGEILYQIAEEHPNRVDLLFEPDPVWREMGHRQTTLEAARRLGGTHFAVIDADEILSANLVGKIRPAVEALQPGEVLESWMPCLWRSIYQYRADPGAVWSRIDGLSLAFRDAPGLSWQHRNGYDHHHRHPFGSRPGPRPFGRTGGVMHLQFVVRRRLLAKQALYKMIERVRWPDRESIAALDRKYSQATDEAGLVTVGTPMEWWEPYNELLHHLDLSEGETWQEREIQRLYEQHGSGLFAGLGLYGFAGAGSIA